MNAQNSSMVYVIDSSAGGFSTPVNGAASTAGAHRRIKVGFKIISGEVRRKLGHADEKCFSLFMRGSTNFPRSLFTVLRPRPMFSLTRPENRLFSSIVGAKTNFRKILTNLRACSYQYIEFAQKIIALGNKRSINTSADG